MTLPYIIRKTTRQDIEPFINQWHYSHSINGVKEKYNFKLLHDGEIIGAMLFAELAMAGQYKKYCDNEKDIIELRRLCCIDDTMKNTESYFISRCLRWLKQHSDVKVVVSYADPNHGHQGTIYKAANFEYMGLTSKTKVLVWNGKQYHGHAVWTKYKGKLKPFAQKLQDAINNKEVEIVEQLPKHVYIYRIKRSREMKQSTLGV